MSFATNVYTEDGEEIRLMEIFDGKYPNRLISVWNFQF